MTAEPGGSTPHRLGRDYERAQPAHRRRAHGIHYTPSGLAAEVVAAAIGVLGALPERVLDPSCGGGAMLLATLDELVRRGVAPGDALVRVAGIDVDRGAIDVAREAIATWAAGHGVTMPSTVALAVGDALVDDWPSDLDLVVGNPPFGGQLRGSTIRDGARAAAAHRILGRAAGYADTAGLFLVRAVSSVRPGGAVALVQPRSVLASRDAGRVRDLVDAVATVRLVLVPEMPGFDASVHVCTPIVVRDGGGSAPAWAEMAADAMGLAPADLDQSRTLGSVAEPTAGFRDEFYAVARFVHEASDTHDRPRLVTSGSIEPGRTLWGERATTVLRRRFQRPVVDLAALRAHAAGPDCDPRVASQLDLRTRPKVLVATQTRSLEAVVDDDGTLWPSVPVVSVLPRAVDVWSILAILVSREATAWVARRSIGTGLSPGALRVSARTLAGLPIPPDGGGDAWADAAARLRDGAAVDDVVVLDAMTRAYRARD